jgi:mRNA-degrading endonuclease RelE of RelBE toxin-antitoxin system
LERLPRNRLYSRFGVPYRVLFTLENDLIVVYAVKDRREAYE